MEVDPEGGSDELIIDLIATACSVDPSKLSLRTRMYELGLDSLSLVSILSHVSLVQGTKFAGQDVLEALQAPLIGDLIAVAERAAGRTTQGRAAGQG